MTESGLVLAYNIVDQRERPAHHRPESHAGPDREDLHQVGARHLEHPRGDPDQPGHTFPPLVGPVGRADHTPSTLLLTRYMKATAPDVYTCKPTNNYSISPCNLGITLKTTPEDAAAAVWHHTDADLSQTGYIGWMDSSTAAFYGLPAAQIQTQADPPVYQSPTQASIDKGIADATVNPDGVTITPEFTARPRRLPAPADDGGRAADACITDDLKAVADLVHHLGGRRRPERGQPAARLLHACPTTWRRRRTTRSRRSRPPTAHRRRRRRRRRRRCNTGRRGAPLRRRSARRRRSATRRACRPARRRPSSTRRPARSCPRRFHRADPDPHRDRRDLPAPGPGDRDALPAPVAAQEAPVSQTAVRMEPDPDAEPEVAGGRGDRHDPAARAARVPPHGRAGHRLPGDHRPRHPGAAVRRLRAVRHQHRRGRAHQTQAAVDLPGPAVERGTQPRSGAGAGGYRRPAGDPAVLVAGRGRSRASAPPTSRRGRATTRGAPCPGQIGDAVLMGHRTTYGGPFRHIASSSGATRSPSSRPRAASSTRSWTCGSPPALR